MVTAEVVVTCLYMDPAASGVTAPHSEKIQKAVLIDCSAT